MKKIDIVFVMPELNMGGSERVIVNIINSLNRDKFSISLILFKTDGALVDELKSDVKLYDLKKDSVKIGLPTLIKKIYRLKPDILFGGIGHINISLAIFIPILKYLLPNTKFIARQSNILTQNNKHEKFPLIHEWLYKRVYSKYDKIICQTQYMQKDLIENYNFPKDKSIVIPNPIDINRVYRLSKIKSLFPFSSNHINLINVGQFRYQKRHDLLLETLSLLDDNYTLTLIGDGDKKDELLSLAKELEIENRVAFLGHQKNPYSYIKEADIFVLTSEFEGFPNVVLEANLLGLPVIAFKTDGVDNNVIKDGLNGSLVPFADTQALAKRIKEIGINRFDKYKIRDMTIDNYSIDSIIKIYEKFLRDLL